MCITLTLEFKNLSRGLHELGFLNESPTKTNLLEALLIELRKKKRDFNDRSHFIDIHRYFLTLINFLDNYAFKVVHIYVIYI